MYGEEAELVAILEFGGSELVDSTIQDLITRNRIQVR